MNEAAKFLLTYTDFQCFSRSNTDVKTYLCQVTQAQWIEKDQHLIFYISADRFLRNMVRAVVGTLLEVGEGKISIDDFKKIIESKNRSNAGPSVPAQGLFLTKVEYPKTIFINE
jgi:tRNA pseudouridine38-40 synthase